MSNMENFSADELLKRLKENMGEPVGDKTEPAPEKAEVCNAPALEEPAPEEIVEDAVIEEGAPVEKETVEKETVEKAPRVKVVKKYKLAKRASREIAEGTAEKDETAPEDITDATISFDIPVSAEKDQASEKTEEEVPTESVEETMEIEEKNTDEETGDGFDAPTMVIPGVTELEAPDLDAFEAAEEDEAANIEKPIAEDSAKHDELYKNIMVMSGREDELREEIGEDEFRKFMESIKLDPDYHPKEEEKPTGFAFDGDEYEKHEQTSEIHQKYKNEKGRAKLRLFGTAIFALCILIFENMHLLGITLPGAFNAIEYPVVHVFVALQLLVLAAALSYKEMLSGFSGIASFDFDTNTLAALSVSFTAQCDLLIAFFGGSSELRLYNFAAAFILVLCACHDYFNICREMNSFSVVSSKKPKYVVVAETKAGANERDLGYERADENDDLLLNVKMVDFVNGYFATTNKKTDSNRYTPYFIFGAFALSIVFAIITFVNTKNAGTAFAIANLTALMCLPVSLFAVSSLPMFLASKTLLSRDSAIIGEASAGEYSGASTVVFDDKDIFPSSGVKIKSVKVYGDARFDTVLCDVASVFAKLGGPLRDVLANAMADTVVSDNVEFTDSDESGVSAIIDSERTLFIGDAVYMEENDIATKEDYEDEIQLAGGNIRIMYVASGNAPIAKMYIQYTTDPKFESILRKLYKNDMRIVIKTLDPNIDNTLLVGKAKPANYPAKIEKRPIEEAGAQEVRSLESGIVSRADTGSIVSAILLCDKLQHIKFTSGLVKVMSVIVSLIIMLIFIVANSSALILSIFVVIYHLFWVLPVFAISKMYLN